MKLVFLFFYMTFNFLFCQDQKKPERITYDYLTLFERWKLIITSDSFTLTTNKIFGPDTAVLASGTYSRTDKEIVFTGRTTKFGLKTLHFANETNFGIIGGQSKAFEVTEDAIHFQNVMRRVYDTMKFSENLVGTYYRGDGEWACLITLMEDKTYRISESVHGNGEYTEKGVWMVRKGAIKFKPKTKSHWLNDYGDPQSFYYTNEFLIGKKMMSRGEETHYYFVKAPIDW